MMAKEQKRQSEEKQTPIRHYRIPSTLYIEFVSIVVRPDGRSEAEVIRGLIVEAIRRAKEALRSK